MHTNSGNVPAVPDTSTFRVASRASDAAGEPPPITRTSMAALQVRYRSRRRVATIATVVGIAIVVIGVAIAAYYLSTADGGEAATVMLETVLV